MKPYEIILEIEKGQMKQLIEEMDSSNAAETLAALKKHCDILEQAGSITYHEIETIEAAGLGEQELLQLREPHPKRRREADLSFSDFQFTVVGLHQCARKEQIIFELTRRGAQVRQVDKPRDEEHVLQAIRHTDMVILFTNDMNNDTVSRVKSICAREDKMVYTTKQKKIQPFIVGIKNKLKNASLM